VYSLECENCSGAKIISGGNKRNKKSEPAECNEDGCQSKVKAEGKCALHYQRLIYEQKKVKQGKTEPLEKKQAPPSDDSPPSPLNLDITPQTLNITLCIEIVIKTRIEQM